LTGLQFTVGAEHAPILDRALELLFKQMADCGIRPSADALELRQWAQVVLRGLALPPAGLPADDGPVPQLLTIPDAAGELRCGVTKVKKLIATGQLPTVDFDGVRRIRRADLDAYVAGLAPRSFRQHVSLKEA
jgi:excisionase family DNA binding protein